MVSAMSKLFILCMTALLMTPGSATAKGRAATLGLNFGAFGLFNLEQSDHSEFTKADPTFGVTPGISFELSPLLSLGGECMLIWAKSHKGTQHRLILSPYITLRLRFSVAPRIHLYALLAVGMTIWTENDSEVALSPALTDTRLGWSLRAAFGAVYSIGNRWSLFIDAGYGAFSSGGSELWITHDTMLLTAGPRLTF